MKVRVEEGRFAFDFFPFRFIIFVVFIFILSFIFYLFSIIYYYFHSLLDFWFQFRPNEDMRPLSVDIYQTFMLYHGSIHSIPHTSIPIPPYDFSSHGPRPACTPYYVLRVLYARNLACLNTARRDS